MSELKQLIEGSHAFTDGGYAGVVLGIIVILIITIFLSEFLVRVFRQSYHQLREGESAGSIFTVFIRVIIWIIGISTILKSCLGVDVAVIWGALGVGGVALSLGLQNTISNLMGGLTMSFSRSLSIGQWIEVGGIGGTVTDIRWLSTILLDDKGDTHRVPNSMLSSNSVTCKPDFMRTPISLCLSKEANLDDVSTEIIKIADSALDAKGMRYEGKSSVVAAAALNPEGIRVTLVVFSKWEFSTAAVVDCTLTPVTTYLQQNNLVGTWS